MSKYTAQLRTIVDNEINIFDFEYTRTPESIAIISDEQLQNDFIDRYYFREIGFETVERFKHYLKVKWKEELGEFDALLVEYNKSINVKSNVNAQVENKTIFNDTPNSKLNINTDYASSISQNNQKQSGYNGLTEIELLELYHDKIKDIQAEFYDKFDSLFMQIY